MHKACMCSYKQSTKCAERLAKGKKLQNTQICSKMVATLPTNNQFLLYLLIAAS